VVFLSEFFWYRDLPFGTYLTPCYQGLSAVLIVGKSYIKSYKEEVLAVKTEMVPGAGFEPAAPNPRVRYLWWPSKV
jgi:hypothetical protein